FDDNAVEERLRSFTPPSTALLPDDVEAPLAAWVARIIAPSAELRHRSATEALAALEGACAPATPTEVVSFVEGRFGDLLTARAAAIARRVEQGARVPRPPTSLARRSSPLRRFGLRIGGLAIAAAAAATLVGIDASAPPAVSARRERAR